MEALPLEGQDHVSLPRTSMIATAVRKDLCRSNRRMLNHENGRGAEGLEPLPPESTHDLKCHETLTAITCKAFPLIAFHRHMLGHEYGKGVKGLEALPPEGAWPDWCAGFFTIPFQQSRRSIRASYIARQFDGQGGRRCGQRALGQIGAPHLR